MESILLPHLGKQASQQPHPIIKHSFTLNSQWPWTTLELSLQFHLATEPNLQPCPSAKPKLQPCLIIKHTLDRDDAWTLHSISSPTQRQDTAGGPDWPEILASDLILQQSTATDLSNPKAQPVTLPKFGEQPVSPPYHKAQPKAPHDKKPSLQSCLNVESSQLHHRLGRTTWVLTQPGTIEEPSPQSCPITQSNHWHHHARKQTIIPPDKRYLQRPASGHTWLDCGAYPAVLFIVNM